MLDPHGKLNGGAKREEVGTEHVLD